MHLVLRFNKLNYKTFTILKISLIYWNKNTNVLNSYLLKNIGSSGLTEESLFHMEFKIAGGGVFFIATHKLLRYGREANF